jgi:hypothetical protein
MAYLLKYMKDFGWNADILTTASIADGGFESYHYDGKIIRVVEIDPPNTTFLQNLKTLFSLKRNFYRHERLFVDAGLKNFSKNDYDLLLTSTSNRIYVLSAAYIISKTWGLKITADLRDIYEQYPIENKKQKKLKDIIIYRIYDNYISFVLKKRNFVLERVNTITSVTTWHTNLLRSINSNSHTIFNGFDHEVYYPQDKKSNLKFKIIYTGTIHDNSIQDPSLLFDALISLIEKKLIQSNDLEIIFYTPLRYRNNIINTPSYDKLNDFIKLMDYVDTSKVPFILNEASILLLLSNKMSSTGPKALNSTTKYYEYLAVERPILCVRSDESLLEESINAASAGVSARNVDQAYDFILEKYKEWKVNGYTTQNVNRVYTKQFSRKVQAKQFVELFESVLNQTK